VNDGEALSAFKALAGQSKVVAIGECGLDYFYNHSPAEAQKELLHFQLALAQEYKLPVIFHVRDAFDDFWPIFDQYKGLKGVIHSFTADTAVLEQILARGLCIGINGIMTFTKNAAQLAAARAIPLDRLVLETDAPFLTPTPFRGTICEPKYVRVTAEFMSRLRNESLEDIATATTHNAAQLFKL
jgi:TatD DNase family protein